MRKILFLLMVLLVASFAFANGGQEATGAEFIVVNGAEPESLDPHLISGVPEHRIYEALFEGLTIYDGKTADGIPGAAESWDVSADGTVYTFKLRDAVWSDGTPVTAQQFEESFIRILDPNTAAPYAWFPSMFLKGAEAFNGGEGSAADVGVKAIDDKTFQIELVGPLPYVIGALAHYSFAVVPTHAIAMYGDSWTTPENFVGNGPYVLEEWVPQDKLTVVPNDRYWDKDAVNLDRVVFLPIDDNNTGYNMFLNGEADWMTTVPQDQIEVAKLRDDYHVNAQLASYYYVIQNEKAPLDDPRIRKALSMSIDRQELVDKITKAGQIPAYGITPPMTGYDAIEGNGENVAAAQELLAQAGYAGGAGFPTLEILYNTSEGHKRIGEFIQQEWSENLGIDVTLLNQEWATYLSTRRQGDFQIARAGWVGDYQDPNTFLDMFVTGGAMNGGRYSNAKYDELITKAATMDPGPARMAALQEAENTFITEDGGIIPLYYYVTLNMIDTNKWGGWYENVMDYHPVKEVYLK